MTRRETNQLARTFAPLLTIAILALLGPPAGAQEEATSPVEITAVTVTPAEPGPDTLCQLRVTLKSSSDQTISQLGFEVKLNGQPIPVYSNQLFMEPLAAGSSREVRLYNFWTTETGRPAPEDGTFDLEVSLVEAHFYEITQEEDAEVWTPKGAIDGLPVSRSISFPMAGATSGS